MIKRTIIIWINLIYFSALMFFKIKNKNINFLFLIILVIWILINLIILFIQIFADKPDSHLNCEIKMYNEIDIELKKPEYKSSNDELMKLISEYNKNNKFGDKK